LRTSFIAVEAARAADAAAVKRLLAQCALPVEDLGDELADFLVARTDGGIAGAVGLEPLGAEGLFRSLAVRVPDRGKGIGRMLCDKMFTHARMRGIARLYLLTTDAQDFFRKLGFEKLARSAAPAGIRASAEFRSLCPASAAVMTKDL
jgi:amino-acid N-acetyltransferase